MGLNVIILAAGEGRRMRSRRPKVLADLAGRPLLAHVLERARALEPERLRVIVGHGADAVRSILSDDVETVIQPEQRGTGDAVACGLEGLSASSTVLVLYGDVPLVEPATMRALTDAASRADSAILTVELPDPAGYGRVLRDIEGSVERVVEDRDATPGELAVREVNTGLLAMKAGPLAHHVAGLDRDNAQGEYYLTDIIARIRGAGGHIEAVQPGHVREVTGVNSRSQLAALEREWQRHLAARLMDDGATLRDPERIDIRGELTIDVDVTVDVGCVFEGRVELQAGTSIGPHCILRNCRIGPEARIEGHTLIDEATIGAGCRIGPFARLRPGVAVADNGRIGNFVEVKNACVGRASKINHLAYVGDAEIGDDVNVGAGVITCNYDGHRKHRTVIGDGAFIGSDCQLVAPVTIGARATIGAGSTITRDAPADQLTLSRTRQQTFSDWRPPAEREGGDD